MPAALVRGSMRDETRPTILSSLVEEREFDAIDS
jgi:hypothetical protein